MDNRPENSAQCRGQIPAENHAENRPAPRCKPRVREVILVEGKYDQNTLSQVVDATILTTDGFRIFKDKEKAALLRRLAMERGVILFTDSDGGGLVIRNHLRGILPPDKVKEAFIPDVRGKERRKRVAGKEGKLGVEGMPPAVLLEALRRCGALEAPPPPAPQIAFTKADLFALGLTGTPSAKTRRLRLQSALNLPSNLSTTALLKLLNTLTTPEEVAKLLEDGNISPEK